MYFKIVFFVATLCVVNASVITNTVYDDSQYDDGFVGEGLANYIEIGPDEEAPQMFDIPEENYLSDDLEELVSEPEKSTRICINLACDIDCRRRGFPRGGRCINKLCVCTTRSVNDAVEVPEEFNSALIQDNKELTDTDLDAADPVFAPKCKPKRCKRFCRLLGKVGSCVDGKCKCVKKQDAIERNVKETDVAELLSESEEFTRSCNNFACDRACRRSGFRGGGRCINNRCVCRSRSVDQVPEQINVALIEDEEKLADNGLYTEDPVFATKCQPKRCERFCRLLGKNGSCVDGKCKCAKKEGLESSPEGYFIPICNNDECHKKCLRKGYRGGGLCIFNMCQCRLPRGTEDEYA
ncbi:uncharacterized protein LOC142974190 [Anticarsia gemmatalis]|uniref:uncharacterized protein LOC142974190 n=1 Tax=Anticarsia gemmatalis TaxID=129554 RepID=UPI003F76F6DA